MEDDLSGFCPWEDGFEELPGVFPGRVSTSIRAFRLAIRASCDAILSCADASRVSRDAISASFPAWLKLLRSVGEGVHRQDQPDRRHVWHGQRPASTTDAVTPGEQLRERNALFGGKAIFRHKAHSLSGYPDRAA